MNPLVKVNLNGKKFRTIVNSENEEISSETIFHYRQNGNIIWSTYEGGGILFGTLSGRIDENNQLIFTYQHQNNEGDFKTGKCVSTPEIVNDKIRLNEKWEWTCDDYSKGEPVDEEV